MKTTNYANLSKDSKFLSMDKIIALGLFGAFIITLIKIGG